MFRISGRVGFGVSFLDTVPGCVARIYAPQDQ